jgi:hypothetical protein
VHLANLEQICWASLSKVSFSSIQYPRYLKDLTISTSSLLIAKRKFDLSVFLGAKIMAFVLLMLRKSLFEAQ